MTVAEDCGAPKFSRLLESVLERRDRDGNEDEFLRVGVFDEGVDARAAEELLQTFPE